MAVAAGLVEVRVPDLGAFKDVAVIDVLVKPGESVENESPLVTLESDKATMDVPSSASGVVEKVHINKGGTVNTGDLIATLRASGGDGATAKAQGAPKAPPAAATASPQQAAASAPKKAGPAPAVQAAASAAPKGPSGASLVEVRVPDLGNFKDVAVIDVLVKPGDSIAIDTPLVTLESDKATMDVPSTTSGIVEKIHASK